MVQQEPAHAVCSAWRDVAPCCGRLKLHITTFQLQGLLFTSQARLASMACTMVVFGSLAPTHLNVDTGSIGVGGCKKWVEEAWLGWASALSTRFPTGTTSASVAIGRSRSIAKKGVQLPLATQYCVAGEGVQQLQASCYPISVILQQMTKA